MAVAVALTLSAAPPVLAEEPVTTFTLDNGLNVVVIEDHRAPVVVQMIWYRVGAADEPAGHSGIAHFLEHLMFKGTEKIAPNAFSGIVEAQGGDDNAFTSWDYTAYFQRIAADRLDLVMEMEADRMRNLRLTEEDVTTERQVILEERAQRTDSDPGALLMEQIRAAQFLNSPYGVPVIGWRHEMTELSREDALEYYERHPGDRGRCGARGGEGAGRKALRPAQALGRDRPARTPAGTPATLRAPPGARG
jgi:zinc protease